MAGCGMTIPSDEDVEEEEKDEEEEEEKMRKRKSGEIKIIHTSQEHEHPCINRWYLKGSLLPMDEWIKMADCYDIESPSTSTSSASSSGARGKVSGSLPPIIFVESTKGLSTVTRLNPKDPTATERKVQDGMERVKDKAKGRLRNKVTYVSVDTAADPPHLEKVYTQLYLKRDCGESGRGFHEILEKFRSSDTPVRWGRLWSMGDEQIDCINIFGHQPGSELPVRRVMMKGIAGIGKTLVIQWFSLQWAEGKSNQHIDFIFVLPFRELNLLKEGEYSLFELLCRFVPDLRALEDAKSLVDEQVLFILDGLDESRFSLDFANKTVYDPDQTSTIDVLLTNLIKRNLFPNALLWITSRPAAAIQIPPKYIDQTIEISGFTDRQKEEYFRKRFSDENQAKEIISRTKGSLSFMSSIPIFCWIIAEVFKKEKDEQKSGNITTMTELYIQYLLIQTQRAVKKYEENRTEEMDLCLILESSTFAMFLKLAQLAFEELKKGTIIFYEEDLRRCGIDVEKASVFCGLCSMLKEECVLYERKVFSFVHLSFQEFLAAVYMFHCCVTKNIAALKSILEDVSADLSCHELMKRVVDNALRNKDGQLDLFLSFFLGISLESNQTLLQGFLPQTENRSETAEEMRRYLTKPHGGNISPERQMNLFLCKYEMKTQGVQNEIQTFIKSKVELSPIYCSVLSSMLLMSEEVLDEINLVNCNIPAIAAYERLLPAIKNCRKAKLWAYDLEDKDVLTSIVQSADSSLRDLHLVHPRSCSFRLGPVLATLRSPGCKLETLRLSGYPLGPEECDSLASVIQSSHSLLRELNLRYCFPHDHSNDDDDDDLDEDGGDDDEDDNCNDDDDDDLDEDGGGDDGDDDDNSNDDADDGDNCDNSLLTVLPAALRGPTCNLEKFTMIGCRLTHEDCELFASVLSSNSHLRELDLSDNDLQDSGVKLLSDGLASPDCKLEILRLSGCRITEEGCVSLATALSSNPSHLRELDLSLNHPGDSGIKLLSDRQMDPNCRLEKLNVEHDEEHWINPQLLKKYDCQIILDPNSAQEQVVLSEGNKRMDWVTKKCSDRPEIFPFTVSRESLTGRCYWEVEYPKETCADFSLGVTYGNMSRKRQLPLEYSNESWSCRINRDTFSFLHNFEGDFVSIGGCEIGGRLQRLGVYLDWPAGILSFYMVSADTMIHLYTFKTTFAEPLYPAFYCSALGHLTLCRIHKFTVNETKTSFTPEMLTDSYASTLYKFRFPGAGVFQCGLTGLVFGVEGEGEVQYKTVQWDESLLLSAGRTPAGPLFRIQCPQSSVSQLQLPHCGTSSALSCDGLSVVHITDDGLTILEPLRITQTHVVVNVPHLSSFGLVWLLEWMFPLVKSVSSQVLLLLRPGRRRRVLYVFMLASNVPHQEVKAQHEQTECLTTTSNCVLTKGESYRLSCDPGTYELQPESEVFDLNYGPNYHPTFEVFLDPNAEDLFLRLVSSQGRFAWSRRIHLTDCLPDAASIALNVQTQNHSPEKELFSVRKEFIKRVSDPVLNSLLDGLLTQRVINDEEMESAKERVRQEKARDIVDMVRRKGSKSSQIMIDLLHQLDSNLCEQLNLR